jgi:carbonic anhydrase
MSESLLIVDANSEERIAAVRELFQEYWSSFGFTPCFQGFGEELRSLPGQYGPPQGRLFLALLNSDPAGCIALRRIDEIRCEAKRLYVRPMYRGHGIAQALMNAVIAAGRDGGYREMVGDTMPVMKDALRMYDRMGFERTGPYVPNPTAGAIFLRLPL